MLNPFVYNFERIWFFNYLKRAGKMINCVYMVVDYRHFTDPRLSIETCIELPDGDSFIVEDEAGLSMRKSQIARRGFLLKSQLNRLFGHK